MFTARAPVPLHQLPQVRVPQKHAVVVNAKTKSAATNSRVNAMSAAKPAAATVPASMMHLPPLLKTTQSEIAAALSATRFSKQKVAATITCATSILELIFQPMAPTLSITVLGAVDSESFRSGAEGLDTRSRIDISAIVEGLGVGRAVEVSPFKIIN